MEDKDPGIRLILAKVYEFSDRDEMALEVLLENLKLDPGNIKTLYALSEYYAKGKDEEATQKHQNYLRMLVEKTPENDYYYSITIPSLIVATYGGGTGLATQKECLDILGCLRSTYLQPNQQAYRQKFHR